MWRDSNLVYDHPGDEWNEAWTAEWSMMFPDEGTRSLDILVDAADGSYLVQSGSKLAMLQPLP